MEAQLPTGFAAVEQQYGLPAGYLGRTAHIESRGNPLAQNERSSAGGLFQFIDRTARQYGLENRFDPVQATDAAARLARDNAAHLSRVLGRPPTGAELYLAHQQGAGGASKLLGNPNARAVDIVGADAVRLNGGHAGMTAGEFANLWLGKFDQNNNRASGVFPGNQQGAGQMQAQAVPGAARQQRPTSFFDGLRDGAQSGALWEQLAMTFNNLRHQPNEQLTPMIMNQRQSRDQQGRRNQTADWLRSQGLGQYADAVEAGSLDAGQVLSFVEAQRAREAAAARGPDPTAFMQNYQFLRGQGASHEEAIGTLQKGGNTFNLGDQGKAMGTIPPGYTAVPDPSNPAGVRFEPIPGGPAEAEASAAAAANEKRQQNTQQTADIVVQDIGEVQRIVEEGGLLPVTGALSGVIKQVPGSNAYDVNALLDTIRANIGFETLNQMRQSSPTGAGLGNVTNIELDLLQATMGNLDQSQTEEQFLRNLQRVSDLFEKVIHEGIDDVEGSIDVRDARQPTQRGDRRRSPRGTQPTRRRYNPETGRLE